MSVKLLLWFFLAGYGGDDITVFGGSQWGCCFVATGGWFACLWVGAGGAVLLYVLVAGYRPFPGRYDEGGVAMPMRLIRNLEDTVDRQAVASRSEGYVGRFSHEQREKLKDGTYDYNGLTRDYYDLVTSFCEYGWGDSFHFAPLYRDKSFLESIRLHETYLEANLGHP